MASYDTKHGLRNRWEADYRALGRSRIGRPSHYPRDGDTGGKGVKQVSFQIRTLYMWLQMRPTKKWNWVSSTWPYKPVCCLWAGLAPSTVETCESRVVYSYRMAGGESVQTLHHTTMQQTPQRQRLTLGVLFSVRCRREHSHSAAWRSA
jgi:hypothetical protein